MRVVPGQSGATLLRRLARVSLLGIGTAAAVTCLCAAEAPPPAASPEGGSPSAAAAPASIFCPVCGAENRPGSRFCRNDGAPMPALDATRRAIPSFVRSAGTYSAEEIQEIMQRVARSVVRIRVRATTTYKYPITWWKDDVSEYYHSAQLGKIETSSEDARSAGSGFAISSSGEIVTNAHVATPDGLKAELTVETQDGRSFPARLVGSDAASDLALISIDSDAVPPLEWGDSDGVKVGQESWAIGNPLDIGISITRGTISSIAGTRAGFNQIESYLHSDAHITHGNSGGPLVDLRGRVIGVSDMGFDEAKGQGYSIPSLMARVVTERLRRGGRYERGYVGAILKVIDSDVAAQYGLANTRGTVVDVVLPGMPAEKAGLKPGDVIQGVNGRAIPTSYHLQEAVSSVGPSAPIALNIVRKGSPMSVSVTTALRPEAPRADPLAEMQGYLRVFFEEDAARGLVYLRDPHRSRRAPGLWNNSLVKSVLPAQDWPEEAITLNYYKVRAKPAPVRSLSDLRKALARAYVGGRMAATFEIDYPTMPVASVVFDVLWPIVI